MYIFVCIQDERLERQRIEQILLDEDIRQKEENKARQELEKKLRNAYEIKEITAIQMENRLRKMEEEKLEDLKFCKQVNLFTNSYFIVTKKFTSK